MERSRGSRLGEDGGEAGLWLRPLSQALTPLRESFARKSEEIANRLTALVLPALKLLILLWIIFFATMGIYYALYRYLLPRFLVNEPVHFDFDAPSPSARIQLLLPEDHSAGFVAPGHYGQAMDSRFLRSGSIYTFSLRFRVTRSHRNIEIGKFMSRIAVVDRSGRIIARANRPVVVPYRSFPVRAADQLLRWPLYLAGVAAEEDEVEVEMIRKFREGTTEATTTQLVEINISRSDVDVSSCEITIYPELSVITYFLLHFPFVSFSFGVMICFWGILSTLAAYVAVSVFVRTLRSVELNLEDGDEAEIIATPRDSSPSSTSHLGSPPSPPLAGGGDGSSSLLGTPALDTEAQGDLEVVGAGGLGAAGTETGGDTSPVSFQGGYGDGASTEEWASSQDTLGTGLRRRLTR